MKTKLIEITISSGVMAPEELQRLGSQVAQALGKETQTTVIISGRLPVWAFAHLAILAAARGARVATFDPRVQGGIVVWPAEEAGQTLPVTGEETRREIAI
jgi:CRISPR-associated Csx3 family protein